MKRLFKFRYPKIAFFGVMIIASYFIFKNPSISNIISNLGSLHYLGIFIGGLFLGFGFLTPLAVGFFIKLDPVNFWPALLIGSFAALLSDLLIFNFLRFLFKDEFTRLENTKTIREISTLLDRSLGHKIKLYLMFIFAEFLILTPLPDEAGLMMLAGLPKINQSVLAVSSFILHFIGLVIILNI